MRRSASIWLPPLAAVLAAAGLVVVARFYEHLPVKPPPCGLRNLTGIPCFGCGGTRCMMALAHGDIIGAIAFNPLVVLGLLTLLVWLGVSIRRAGKPSPIEKPARKKRRWVTVAIVLAVLANWAYLIAFLPEP